MSIIGGFSHTPSHVDNIELHSENVADPFQEWEHSLHERISFLLGVSESTADEQPNQFSDVFGFSPQNLLKKLLSFQHNKEYI
jgi:hypothetical protein